MDKFQTLNVLSEQDAYELHLNYVHKTNVERLVDGSKRNLYKATWKNCESLVSVSKRNSMKLGLLLSLDEDLVREKEDYP